MSLNKNELEKIMPIQHLVERIDRNNRAEKSTTCYFNSCNEQAICSHTVPKNFLCKLSSKSLEGVLSLEHNILSVMNNKPVVKKVNQDEFSTFYGFCEKHDNALFKEIDEFDGVMTKKKAVLIHYRSICFGIARIKRQIENYQCMANQNYVDEECEIFTSDIKPVAQSDFFKKLILVQNTAYIRFGGAFYFVNRSAKIVKEIVPQDIHLIDQVFHPENRRILSPKELRDLRTMYPLVRVGDVDLTEEAYILIKSGSIVRTLEFCINRHEDRKILLENMILSENFEEIDYMGFTDNIQNLLFFGRSSHFLHPCNDFFAQHPDARMPWISYITLLSGQTNNLIFCWLKKDLEHTNFLRGGFINDKMSFKDRVGALAWVYSDSLAVEESLYIKNEKTVNSAIKEYRRY